MAKIYTFKDLQDAVLRQLDEDSNTAATTLTLVKNSIQQAHLSRVSSYDWWFMLWPYPVTFNTTVNQQNYSLHSEFFKPFYFFNQTTKAYLVEENSRELGPSGVRWNSDSGHATRFSFWGRSPISTQLPLTGSTLSIVSSSSADTTQTVTIRGNASDGLGLITETLTANGTTTVTSTNTFYNPILNITLSAAFAGTLTVKAGTTTILTLSAGEFGRTYPQIYLLSIPNAVDTIEYRFYRQPSPLVNDHDIPDIPPPFQQILIYDALVEVSAYNADTDPTDVMVWEKARQTLEAQMITANDEALSLESEPRYIRYAGEEPDAPRIYTT